LSGQPPGAGSGHHCLENFLDATHTHFVHAGWVRSPGPRTPTKVDIRAQDDWVEATYWDEAPQSGWIPRLLEGGRSHSIGRFRLPWIAEIEYHSKQALTFAVTAFVISASAQEQVAQVLIATPKGILPGWLKRLILQPLLLFVTAQDQRMVKMQSDHLAKFSGPRYHQGPLDLLRPHMVRLLEGGPIERPVHRQVVMEL
jgi:hypothetical protein